jgi:hypothetical protein
MNRKIKRFFTANPLHADLRLISWHYRPKYRQQWDGTVAGTLQVLYAAYLNGHFANKGKENAFIN